MDTPGGWEGDLNGATWVTAVPAPAAGVQRIVGKLLIFNADTVNHTAQWRKVKGASPRLMGQSAPVAKGLWTPITQQLQCTLDDIDEKIEVSIEAAHTSVAPSFDASFMDCADEDASGGGGALSKGTLGLVSNVTAGETVTIGADVYEAVNVGTDSGKFTALSEWNNTNPVIAVTITAHGLVAGDFVGLASGELFKVINVVDADHLNLMAARGGTVRTAYGNGGPIYKQNNAVTSGRIPWPYNGATVTPTPAVMRPSLVCEINNTAASGEQCVAQASTIYPSVQAIVIAYPATNIRVEAIVAGIAYSLAETMAGAGNLWTAAAMA